MIQALEQYTIEDLLAALAVKQNAAPDAANEHEQQQAIRDQQLQAWERLAKRPGLVLPTPENLDRVADEAADKRAHETQTRNMNANELGRAWGVSRDFVLFIQRLEGKVIELEREVAQLRRNANALPPHMRDREIRG